MKDELYKTKVQIVTIFIEICLIGLLFLIAYFILHNVTGLTSDLDIHTLEDDVIDGWHLLGLYSIEFIGFFGAAFLIVTGALYYFCIVVVLGWNMLMNTVNKEEKTWIFIIGIVPSILFSIFIIGTFLLDSINSGSIFMFLLILPGLVLFIQNMIQIKLFTQRIR